MREEHPLLIALEADRRTLMSINYTSRIGDRVESHADAIVSDRLTDHRREIDESPDCATQIRRRTWLLYRGRTLNERENFGDDVSPLCPRLCRISPGRKIRTANGSPIPMRSRLVSPPCPPGRSSPIFPLWRAWRFRSVRTRRFRTGPRRRWSRMSTIR